MSGHSRNDRDRHRTNSSRSHHAASGTKSRSSNLNDHHSRGHSSRSGIKSEDSGKSRSGESNSSNSNSRSFSNANLAFNDVSIGRLAKILGMLESKKEFLSSCSQIEELLLSGENQAYVQRSFSRLALDFQEVFYGLPSVSWKALGIDRFTTFLMKVLEAMARNYNKMIQWIVELTLEKPFQQQEALGVFQMVTLGMLPRMNPKHLTCLTGCIINILEHTESTKAFKILSSLCMSSLLSNSEMKMTSFMDFIDVVFGWVLSDTDESILPFCFNVMHVMADYFRKDIVFATTMLQHLFDDFYDVGSSLKNQKDDFSDTERLLRLVKTASAMMSLDCNFEKTYLTTAFKSFVSTASEILENPNLSMKVKIELMAGVNDCLSYEKIDCPELRVFIKSQLDYFNTSSEWMYLSTTHLISFVNCLSNWLDGTSIQIRSADEEAETMLQETTKFIDIIRPRLEPDGQACILRAVHSLLRTRNISCLQISYNWLVSKLKLAENGSVDSETVLFVLGGVSDIAGIKTGSILSQWALDPSIFDLLISVLSWPVCKDLVYPIESCALQLLRAHCEAHSHFVSSIASSKTFVTEQAGSRSTRILPTLMQFWLELLARSQTHYDEWLFEWIFRFVTASSQFASILVKSDQEFYTSLLDKLFRKPELHSHLLALLKWLNEDQHYNKSEFILRISLEMVTKLSMAQNTKRTIQAEAKTLLASFGFGPSQPENARTLCNGESASAIQQKNASEQIHFSYITTFEFNSFLYNLLSYDKTETEIDYSAEYIKSTAEFLLQSKLKSSFGKPQEFFGYLGGLFRRHKLGKLGPTKWKLDFVYQLERNIVNAIHGSTFIPCNISEGVRSFYITNKNPCMEWFKRMRPDLAEVSLSVADYSYAFLCATASGDELTTKFALLELKDAEGLKALSELGAYYYLQNDLSNAEKFVKIAREKTANFQASISKRIEAALKEASAALEVWSGTNGNGVQGLDAYINQNLWEKVKISDQLTFGDEEEGVYALECLQLMRTETQSLGRALTIENMKTLVETVSTDPVLKARHYVNLADLFYKEAAYDKTAALYKTMADLVEMKGHELDPSLKAKFYLSCAAKLDSSPDFYRELVPQLEFLSTSKHKTEVLQHCYENATSICPADSSAWFEYGNFAYSSGESVNSGPETSRAMKALAQQCYSKCVVLQGNGEQSSTNDKWRRMQIKTRLLSLHKAGYKFNPEEVLIQDDWLQLLPSLTRCNDLRPHLVRRFPEQASFLTAAYSKERKFSRVIGRRSVFDPHAFIFTEASDEVFNPACHCKDGFKTRGSLGNSEANDHDEHRQDNTGVERNLINPNVYVVIEELQKIGTTREQFWSWGIERIISDASKKLSALRKDMARESDVLKVKAYTLPLITYLNELWNITVEARTVSEMAFLNKFGSRIRELLTNLKNCTTADDFNSAIEEIIAFGSMFDTSNVSRLDLHAVSPVLANLEQCEVNNSSPVHVPGLPSHVTLAGVHPTINCLHTKAKPKRLSLRGSNGRLYEFLVKGNENLNIDSGVMQLLKISQELISLPTRTYSIAPFGERGGLIQIVNNAQPVYIMYKRHLQRINCSERPAFMFFRMLNDLGFSDRSNFDALKSVYAALVKETDPDIISRELFICSENASNWLSSTRTFTQDAAIGATIGYLVGIGDRHLDNILLNPGNGNMVHVDFSLLFGRGTTLQVPEIVPFRLTQNFVSCLQHPGVNGPFRVYMEDVFELLKQHNDSFMFGAEEIALSTQCDEDATVESANILLAELNSAIGLLRFRSKNIKNALQALKTEVLEMIDRKKTGFSWSVRGENVSSLDKLKKKLNRWRRLLANVDPLIQLIGKYAQPDSINMQSFQETVANVWLPSVIHFWCHSSVDKLLEGTHHFPDQLSLADEILLLLLHNLPPPETTLQCNESMLTRNEIEVDSTKIQPQILGTKEKFASYDEHTIENLITSAMSGDNLCQMFEGWTPWV